MARISHEATLGLIAATIALTASACTPLAGSDGATFGVSVKPTPRPGATTRPVTPGGASDPKGPAPIDLDADLPDSAVPPTTEAPAGGALPAAPTLTEAHKALVPALQSKLSAVAQAGFLRSQAKLLSDKGAGVISNNAAGLISNNGGGVIANGGAGYRVRQVDDTAIIAMAKSGEALAQAYVWPDDSQLLAFASATAPSDDFRTVILSAEGIPTDQAHTRTLARWPNGSPKQFHQDVLAHAADDGRFLVKAAFSSFYDEAGQMTRFTIDPNGLRWQDAKFGFNVRVSAFDLSYPDDKGSYRFEFPGINQAEEGTLTKLRRNAAGTLDFNIYYPYTMGDLEAKQVDAAGKTLFTRRVVKQGEEFKTTYDLGDGLAVRLDRFSADGEVGKLVVSGREEADALLARRPDGSHLFTITFPEDKAHPLVIGFGHASPVAVPDAAPAKWQVTTLAGPDGAGKFENLTQLVASVKTPGRFYAADPLGETIRVIDVADGKATIGVYAGTGTAGAANGLRTQATFNNPNGLAIGPDDTLYVADTGNHCIRAIAPDGMVTTLVGATPVGTQDGDAATARFSTPVSLARGEDGTLYVAEYNGLIRAVAPNRSVRTLAGTANADAFADGSGAAARFHKPRGIALAADGALLVADTGNHRLRRVTLAGAVTTVAGGGAPGTEAKDGVATQVIPPAPRTVTVGPDGLAYLGSLTVRTLRADGRLTSYAGLANSDHLDGPHDEANFTAISALAFGPNGLLLVADGPYLRAVTPPSKAQ